MKKIFLLFTVLILTILISIPKVYSYSGDDDMPNRFQPMVYNGGVRYDYQSQSNPVSNWYRITYDLFNLPYIDVPGYYVVFGDRNLTTVTGFQSRSLIYNSFITSNSSSTLNDVIIGDLTGDLTKRDWAFIYERGLSQPQQRLYFWIQTDDADPYELLVDLANFVFETTWFYVLDSSQGNNSVERMNSFYYEYDLYWSDLQYLAGFDVGYSQGYNKGYAQSIIDNINPAYNDGYDLGYDVGYGEGLLADYSAWEDIQQGFFGPFNILNFELLPGFKIGYVFAFFMIIGVLSYLIGKRKA